jgi:O-antigen ligase
MSKVLLHKIYHQLDIIFPALIVSMLMLFPDFVSIFIILYILVLITQKKFDYSKIPYGLHFTMISFYLVYVISLIWTKDIKSGLFDCEVKLSLFIFPIIISFLNYSKEKIEKTLFSISCSILIVTTFLILRSAYSYFTQGLLLTYNDFSINTHPTYYSMYALFAMIYVLFQFNNHWKWLILLILSAGIILSSSKAGFISLLFIICVYAFFRWRLIYVLFTIAILFSATYYLLYKTNYLIFLSDRIKTTQEIFNKYLHNEPLRIESNSVRLYAWKAAVVTILNNNWLIGVGCGDIHQHLNEYFQKNNLQILAEKNINAHNTYLEICLSIGIIGLFLFLYLIISIIKKSFKQKVYFITYYFISIALFYFTTEAVLETQGGTVFFGLISSLIIKYLSI